MQGETPVKIDRRILQGWERTWKHSRWPARRGRLHCNRRPQVVVPLLEKRNHDVQPVARTALKNCHQDLFLGTLCGRGPPQPHGSRTDGGHRDRGTPQEQASRHHVYLLWKSGELSTRPATNLPVASWPSRLSSASRVCSAGSRSSSS